MFRFRGWRTLTHAHNHLGRGDALSTLGDFTTTRRVVLLSFLALGIGVFSAFVALALLRLIGLFTNLFFFQRWDTTLVSPAGHTLGLFVVLIPIVGALIIGLLARYGSERIRGHGIPEAIEAILINGSRVEPRVAFLKPLSAAISIGSGGPFGAEGPIIMTGGAFGSLIAQFFRLTSSERKTLLVAGAAAGMSATFASPVAAVLLAVELLLFEWKPRSLIPVALASAVAGAVRRYIIGLGPLFPVPPHPMFIGPEGLAGCVLAGLFAGALSALLTMAVYAAEDGFRLLPIHWMWWPALGGLIIGLGGLVFPQALGVGYDMIDALLQGNLATHMIAGILLVKSVIWAASLGSGTSGGVLAPLLLMGGALGGLEASFLPNEGAGFWPLISMGAILGGTMRSPFTGIIFTLELTHDVNVLLPLLVATIIAHAFTVLTLRRSILTEKVSRRGYHLSREYAIDPLEILFVREVMRTNSVVLPADSLLSDVLQSIRTNGDQRGQRLYPVVDNADRLVGVVTRSTLKRRTLVDYTATATALTGISIPEFWFAILCVLFFALYLGWLPASEYYSPFDNLGLSLQHLILPATALGWRLAAITTRLTRSAMLDEVRKEYVDTARALGLPERRVLYKYTLRNALIPTVTVAGLQFARLLGGTVVIESIFAWPGIGLTLYEAILGRDYPMVQASVLILSTAFVLVNLLVDLTYRLLNPRIRLA